MPLLVEPLFRRGVLRDGKQPVVAAGDGLVLRPWREPDAAVVQSAFGCPEIQRWHVRRLDSLDEAVEWVGQWSGRWDADSAVSWAVVDEHDEPLGQVGLRNISLAEGSAGISYWVRPQARGRGIATRSVKALSGWAFGQIHFNRLDIQHSVANTASCRVAERTGYPLEGTLRRATKHTDGFHDWHIHGLTVTDYTP